MAQRKVGKADKYKMTQKPGRPFPSLSKLTRVEKNFGQIKAGEIFWHAPHVNSDLCMQITFVTFWLMHCNYRLRREGRTTSK